MSEPVPPALHRDEFIIPESAIDENGHVNNVVFVQWMQDVATRHFEAAGGRAAMQAVSGAWVVRSHKVEYLSPAFVGEHVQAVTWIVNLNRALSVRRYRFLRPCDGKLLVRGETQWVFVSTRTGRPMSIPEDLRRMFSLLPEDYEIPQVP